MLSLTFKDRLQKLKQANTKKPVSLLESAHFLHAYLTFISDLDQTVTSECLDAKQSLTLAEIKIKRLESYLGHSGATAQ